MTIELKHMKKLLLFTAALGLFSGAFAKKVKFQVDMTGKTVNANGVSVAGDFQKAAGSPNDWTPGATVLTKVGTTDIYSIIVDIPAGRYYEFKFINGNTWGDAESVPALSQKGHPNNGESNTNRWFFIDSTANDTTNIPAFLFGGNAPAGQYAVRFAVDLSKEPAVSNKGVHLAGSLQGWNPASTSMSNLYTSNKLYEVIVCLAAGSYEYKYVNGNDWNSPSVPESVPSGCAVNGNRGVTVATADQALPKVCFGSCTACPAAPLPKYNITFRVDMTNSNCDGGYDSVTVAGGKLPGAWGSGTTLNQVGTSKEYSKTIQMDSGEVEFKFRYHKGGNTNWEGIANRVMSFKSDSTIALHCFSTTSACVPKPAPSSITFKVDMSNEVPDAQGRIYVMGTFQSPNWQAGALRLKPVTGEPGKFSITVNNICPGSFNYKFLNGDSSLQASEETFPDTNSRACVDPNGLGGFNRKYTRTDTNAVVLGYVFNKCAIIAPVGLNKITGAFNQVVLYPNPTKEFAILNLNSVKGEVNVLVADITGRVVKNITTKATEIKLLKEELGHGLFFVRLTGNNGETRVMKLIVQ